MRKGLEKFGEVLDAAGNVVRPAGLVAAVGLAHAVFPKVDFEELGRPGLMDLDNAVIPSSGSDDIEWGEEVENGAENVSPFFKEVGESGIAFLNKISTDEKALAEGAVFFVGLVEDGRLDDAKRFAWALWEDAERGAWPGKPDNVKQSVARMLRLAISYLVSDLSLNQRGQISSPSVLTVDFSKVLMGIVKGGEEADKALNFVEQVCADERIAPKLGQLPGGLGILAEFEAIGREYAGINVWIEMLERFGEKAAASLAEGEQEEADRSMAKMRERTLHVGFGFHSSI